MNENYDKGLRDVSFESPTQVWLCLYPFRQLFITKKHRNKLLTKYYGPFKILRYIGNAACQLALPPSKIHYVFHVSLLKPFKGTPPINVDMTKSRWLYGSSTGENY